MKRQRLFLSPIVHLLWLVLPVLILLIPQASAGAVSPALTATKDDGVPAATRKVGGNTVTYTNTITNTGGIDATGVQFLDPDVAHAGYVLNSLKATPVALNDTYPSTVIANTSINTATSGFSVITNDFGGFSGGNPIANTALTISAFDAASTGGGTVSMITTGAGVGQFTYTPAAGFTGTDTFTYTISNGVAGGTAASIKATVSIVVGGPVVWFVDPNSATNGNGTLGSPFNVISSAITAIGANVNQRIFIYTSGGTLTANIPLNTSGWLVGQGAVGTSFDALMGVTYPADTAARPAINNLTKPTITRAFGSTVTLGNGSNVFGVTLQASGTATTLSGAVNTATVGNATTSDVTISNTGSGAVNLGAGNGSIAINASINTSAGTGITVASRTGGTVTFPKDIVVSSGTGIVLSNNTGATISFTGGMALNTGANTAFSATVGGTVTATQNNTSILNTLTTTTGAALNVANTTIGASGLTFRSISSNGATNGIVLNNTGGSGGLTVVGDAGASNNGSGGVIQNSTGVGVSLTSTFGVSLGYINISNSGTDGIKGTTLNGFTMNRCNVTDAATGGATGATDDGVDLSNVSGAFSMTNCLVDKAPHNDVQIDNFNTNMASFTMTGNTISNDPPNNPLGNDGVLLTMRGTSVLPSGNIQSNTFAGMRALAVQIHTNDSGRIGVNSGAVSTTTLTAANSIIVQNNTFTGNGQGVDIATSQISNLTFQVLNNTINGKVTAPNAVANTASSNAINVFTAAGADTGPTTHSFVGKIDTNIIGTQGVKDSGSGFGSGIRAVVQGQATQGVVTISNNTIREVPNATIINIFGQNGAATNSTASAFARFKVTNNTMPAISGSNLSLGGPANTPIADTGIFVLADEGFPNSAVITGNTIYDVTTAFGSFDIYLAVRIGPPAGATLKIEGTGSVSAFTLANNTLAGANKFVDEGAGSGTPSTLVAPGSQGAYPLLFAQGGIERAAEAVSAPGSAGTAPWSAVASEARHRLGNVLPVRSRTASAPPAEPSESGVALSFPAAFQGDADVLSQDRLDAIVSEARARWEATGLTAEQIARLRGLKFEVTTLSNNHLGEAGSDAIRVDRDAGGNGWFAEASAQSDALFGAAKSATRHYTDPASAPAGRVDLLTTILHEMGHALGLPDTYRIEDRESIMFGQLTKGERRLPAMGQAVGAVPFSGDITHYLSGTLNPITIGTLPAGKSVIITYDVQIENPITPITTSQLSSQATIHSTTASFVDFTTADIEGAVLTGSGPTATLLAIPPTITNGPATATGVAGTPYNFTYTFTGIPAPTFSAPGLPTSLAINGATGAISGTPTVAGVFTGTTTASNGFAPDATQAFSITVSPTVTASAASLGINATSLTINGNGFSTTAANNTVVFSGGATGTVTAATSTQLTVTSLSGLVLGNLTAVVTSNTVSSGAAVQVATVVPVVTSSTANLAANATTMTIDGFGFSATPANNTVTFNDGAVGAVTASTANQLTVTFSTKPVSAGSLTASVTTSGVSSGAAVQVATVTPVVTLNAAQIQTTATTVTINGFGFAAANANNSVVLSSGTGSVTSSSPTSITVTFATQPVAGNLTAVVTSNTVGSGAAVQIATVSNLSITPNTANRAQNAPTLLIAGTGFSTTLANNSVVLSSGTAAVTAATSTQLTCTLGGPPALGVLNATVTVTGTGSTGPTQVATIVAPPTVTASTTNRAQNAPTLVIAGTNFDTTPANNTVAFNLGAAGNVTAATATQLTVTFTTAPSTTGSLTAVVTTDGGSSGAALQVATVVPAPTVTVNTTTRAQNAPTIVINGTNFDTTAASNTVAFSLGAVGNVTTATATQLTVTFTTSPTTTGSLTANVTVAGGSSGAVQVATIVPPIHYTVTTGGNAIVVTDTGGVADALTVSEPSAGNIQFDVSGKSFTVNGGAPISGTSGPLLLTGVMQVTLNAGTGADNVTVGAFTGTLPDVAIGSAANKFGTVSFTGAFTLGAANTLTADASGNISITAAGILAAGGNITLSAGTDLLISGNINHPTGADATLTLRADNNIDINSGADVTSTSNKLHVVLNSNRDAIGTGAIFLRTGTVITSNGGDITLGGGANPLTTMAIGNTLPQGILLDSATLTAGAGIINIRGQGAALAGSINLGVRLIGSALVQTTTGNIIVRAQGGTLGNAGSAFAIDGGLITTADGQITITGDAGAGSATLANGINISVSTVAISATGSGSITLTGTGGVGTGLFDTGVDLINNAAVQVNTGALVVTGTAINGNSSGVRLSAGSSGRFLSTGGGPITITGTSFGTGFGFQAGASSVVGGPSATGAITINADKMDLTSGTPSVQTTNTVTLKQKTVGQLINLGAVDSGTTLGLTDAELDRITAPTVRIGDANSGAITVSAMISPLNYKTLGFGNNVTFSGTGGFASDIGPTATDIENVNVTGTVTINPAAQLTLTAVGGFVPVNGQNFQILTNDLADAISGNFFGYSEGGSVPAFLGSGITAQITYLGGTGNDFVLFTNRPPVPGIVSVERYPTQPVKIPVSQITGAATDPDPGDTISLVSVANGTNGTAQIAGNFVLYTPAGNFSLTHTFGYTIQDNHGATANGSVTVTVIVDNAPGQNITSLKRLPDGTAVVSFAGVPGFTYGLQYTNNLANPWQDIGPVTVDAFGAASYTDVNPVHKASLMGFYRFIYPAPAGP